MIPRQVENGPLKVMFYSHSGEVSGAEISLLLTIEHLHGVKALLVAPEGELLQRARNKGLAVRPIRSHRARMSRNILVLLRGLIGTWAAGRELRRIIRGESPQIVHANSIRAGLIAWTAVWGLNTRLLWHVRDNLSHGMVGMVIRRIASIRVDGVFAISSAILNDFASFSKLRRKSMVLYNGVDVSQNAGVSIRDEFGVSADTFVIAVVGQIAPWKRQHDAIQAFQVLQQSIPRSELWIVGTPKFREENQSYEAQLRSAVSQAGLDNQVRFLGFRNDMMNVMTSIDVLLIPSDCEPFGRVIIEAMLAGKPVVGTNSGGIPEIVLNGHTGYLVGVGDTLMMVTHLTGLYRDKPTAIQYGARGRSRVCEDFSIDLVASKLAGRYMELCSM